MPVCDRKKRGKADPEAIHESANEERGNEGTKERK